LIALIINTHLRRRRTDDRERIRISVVRRPASVVRSVSIRKTSLLHKIDPTARRSSFAGSGIGNQVSGARCRASAIRSVPDFRSLLPDPRIPVSWIPESGRSPLHDVRQLARRRLKAKLAAAARRAD